MSPEINCLVTWNAKLYLLKTCRGQQYDKKLQLDTKIEIDKMSEHFEWNMKLRLVVLCHAFFGFWTGPYPSSIPSKHNFHP